MAKQNPSDSGVYWIVNILNGLVYVGSSVSFSRRWRAHRASLIAGTHDNRHLQAAWNKYGSTAFAVELIEPVADRIWLRARESAWIIRTKANKRGWGYNLTQDGFSPSQDSLSEETKRKIGAAHKGRKWGPEFRQKAKLAAIARVTTDEFKEGAGKRRLGKVHSESARDKMRRAWQLRRSRPASSRVLSAEGRERIRAAHLGKKRTPEQINRMSEAQRAGWTPDARAAHSATISKVLTARYKDPAKRQQQSETMQRWWAQRRSPASVEVCHR